MACSSNRRYLADLLGGHFPGHALIVEPALKPPDWAEGDVAVSERLIEYWLPDVLQRYEASVEWHEQLGDDSVPYAKLWTGTESFAAAFGCPVHSYEDSLPCAMPLVTSAAADVL